MWVSDIYQCESNGDFIKDVIIDKEEEEYQTNWDDIELPTEEEYHNASMSPPGTSRK